jgi:signal transduction histidine kinase
VGPIGDARHSTSDQADVVLPVFPVESILAAMEGWDRDTPEGRRRWAGRLASLFFVAAALLGIATLPLLPSDANPTGSAIVSILALVVGIVIWLVPWQRLPQSATLVIVPAAFALIALGNLFGGSDYHNYGIFFVVAFVWIGLVHRPWTSLAMVPLAALAYVLPLFSLPGDVANGLGSAAVTLPICVVAGEALSRRAARLASTEVALKRERDVAERLRALDTMRETFLKAASHELRTPITICRGHLDVLGEAPTPEQLRQTIGIVVDELDRMGRLVEDLTTLTRLSDPNSLQREPLPTEGLMQSVEAKATPLLNERLRMVPPPRGRIHGDQQRLTQALLDLLQNAATHADGASVALSLVPEAGNWRFEVSDRGPGLEGADPEDLFQPFRTGRRSPGSGLGLAIVRAIAEAHGGEAGADDGPGTGATFWIRIPR